MMPIEFAAEDVQVLKIYQALKYSYREEVQAYLNFTLMRQYRQEVVRKVFGDALLHKQIAELTLAAEREEFEVRRVEQQARQVLERYFSLFAEVYCRYQELAPDIDCYEQVKALGGAGREQIGRACRSGDRRLIRAEIADFVESYYQFAKKRDDCRSIAV